MDSALISIIGTIIQAYATILGIVGMYLIFLNQRKSDQVRELATRFKIKSDSLIDFINREISIAYQNQPLIRADCDKPAEVIEAITAFEAERKNDIPNLSTDEVRKLFLLWAIVHREKDGIVQMERELSTLSSKLIMPRGTLLPFVIFFTFVLIFAFVEMLAVYLGVPLQVYITGTLIVTAIIGIAPLGNLIYKIK